MSSASSSRCSGPLLCLGSEVFRPEHLTNLGLALPARPVFLVKFHEADRRFDRLFLRFQLKLCVAADNLLGLDERPVGHSHLPPGKPDAGALRSWPEPPAPEHRAGFGLLFGDLRNSIHQFLGRRALLLGVLDYHESHREISVRFRGWSGPLDGFDRLNPGSTYWSNEGQQNRQVQYHFLENTR